MTNTIDQMHCAACGNAIDEPTNTLPVDRKPCPTCGSLARNLSVSLHETLLIREKWGMKHKRHGHKKPIYESVSGDDLHRDTRQWNKLTREIDRENNRYKEVITNPESGKVLRHCEEPLTDHFNRGSAKPKSSEGS